MGANYFTLLYWFCYTSTWIHRRCTRVPHPEPRSTSLPIPSLWVIPVLQPRASCIMHWTWTGDSFHIWYYTCFNATECHYLNVLDLRSFPISYWKRKFQKVTKMKCSFSNVTYWCTVKWRKLKFLVVFWPERTFDTLTEEAPLRRSGSNAFEFFL